MRSAQVNQTPVENPYIALAISIIFVDDSSPEGSEQMWVQI